MDRTDGDSVRAVRAAGTPSELARAGVSRSRPVYLDLEPDPVLGFVHPAETVAPVGVILCPPFGWAEVSSYRGRRSWADRLAEAGHPSFRLDLPGTGDSGGSPHDPRRLEAWTGAVSAAAEWLRASFDCSRIAAIGMGLGGMLALRAASEDAPIDDLLLWATPATGRVLLRQLRAFGKMAAAQFPDPNPVPAPPLPAGLMEVSGFLISPETADALAALDFTKITLARPRERRILVLGRDGIAPDEALTARLEAQGAEVRVDDGRGYAAFTQQVPEFAQEPEEAFALSLSWLAGTPPPPRSATAGTDAAGPTVEPPKELERVTLSIGGEQIFETVLTLRVGEATLVGVLSEPAATQAADVCAVLLNAGTIRHIGPNRAWVEAARRWAASGVPTMRLDLDGIGESDGDPRVYMNESAFHTETLIQHTIGALSELETRGLPSRFVLAGHCSGAYWAARAALTDDRIAAALMINLETFQWDPEQAAERDAERTLALVRSGGLGWLRRGWVTRERVGRVVQSLGLQYRRLRAGRASNLVRTSEVDLILDRLRDRDIESLILLSRGEALHDDLVKGGQAARLERWPNLALETIPSRDHTFRALWLQDYVHASLDRALARALGRLGVAHES